MARRSALARPLHTALAFVGPYGWPLLVVALSVWPVAGVFTWSRAFVQRDLTLHFWPKYLWLRHTLWGGEWPWWDPFMGGGHAAVADALNQLFLLPTLALRVLLPEPIGYNLWIALPFPLAAVGAYLFFRRHASASGAALGAIVFATSGPVLSAGNFPNVSWSVMFVPCLLWAVDACAVSWTPTRGALLALLFAGQILAGEPVTMVATAALLGAYAVVLAPMAEEGWRPRLRVLTLTALALVIGAALAAVQLLPQLDVASRSMRAVGRADVSFWSVHPLWLLELIAPTLFGNFFAGFLATQPWMSPLNSGRDPFFYSIYVGIPIVLLSIVGLRLPLRRRWATFWSVVAVAGVIAACGDHTAIYPAVQRIVPILRGFRFPAKYLLFMSLAWAALAVAGWTALERRRDMTADADDARVRSARRLAMLCGLAGAVIAYLCAVAALLFPDATARALFRIATAVGMAQPILGPMTMLPELPAHAARLLLLSLVSAGFLWLALSRRVEARRAQWLLFALIATDLAVTNGGLNPTSDVSMLAPPAWVQMVLQHPHERFYFGGRLAGGISSADIDGPKNVTLPSVPDLQDMRVVTSTRVLVTPSSMGAREMTSYDLTAMASLEQTFFLEQFEAAPREKRLLALGRTGVRDCIISEPLPPGAKVLARVQNIEDVALFECHPDATRVSVIVNAEVVKSHRQQVLRLFDEKQSDATILLDAPPPAPAGAAGPPVEPFARFVRDGTNVVEIDAGLPANGGYVLLRDTHEPGWRVEVDGQPAPLLHANGLFRAVRVSAGTHRIRFHYLPMPLVYGAMISGFTGTGLVGLVAWSRRRARFAARLSAVAVVGSATAPVAVHQSLTSESWRS